MRTLGTIVVYIGGIVAAVVYLVHLCERVQSWWESHPRIRSRFEAMLQWRGLR